MTQTTEHTTPSASRLPDIFSEALTHIFEAAQPSIVQVRTEGRGGGTGVVWYKDGRIITNNHVVPTDTAHIQVFFSDGRTLDAKVLARNPRLDLALLKVDDDNDNLKPLSPADSATLRVGEWVFAIGHPWGQRWVLTAGIVSRISSVKLADDLTTQYIQSDVRLAPGNSGGPLLDAEGNVVGINAMIFGGDLSVAIPSNVVKTWLARLPQRRVTLGVEIQTVELPTDSLQSQGVSQETGVLIVGIRPERQAKHNDLFVGDILLSVTEKMVKDTTTLLNTLGESKEQETLPMTILRGGQIVHLNVETLLR